MPHPATAATPVPQMGADTALEQTLNRLSLSATDFTRYVKNVVCLEKIDSERQSAIPFAPRSTELHVHAESELQVENDNGRIEEKRRWISQDGKPLPPGASPNLLYKLTQAFAVPPSAYLTKDHRSCLRFSARQPGRIDFQATPLAGKGICSDIGPEATGNILFEPDTDLILHIERSVPAAAGAAGGFAPFAAVDYGATEKNGRSYQLPRRIAATRQRGTYVFHFDARYSCRILGVSVRLTNADGTPITREP